MPNGLSIGEHTAGWLGFGAAGIGNLYRSVPDDVAAATVDAAWEAGIRYFDTAPHYGLGLSERRLGAALAKRPREEFVLSTKVGRLLEPNPDYVTGAMDPDGFAVPANVIRRWDPSEAGVRRSIEDSLARLDVDHIDIAYLHDPDAYDLDSGIEEGLPALERLRDEGLVGAIGVGSNSVEALARCVRSADLDLVMLAGRYTLLEQPAAADLLPACLENGTGVVNVGVYNSGLLARPEVPDDAHYNYASAPPSVLAAARRLAACCEEYGVDLPTAALQFSMRHPAIRSVVVGAARPEQIRQTAERAATHVPEELWSELERRGLVQA
ncbi:MAG TPA: aldo/keto reductase [Sinomonas sp.]|nr:aldo/keto reductase [Sinomonas sp.]